MPERMRKSASSAGFVEGGESVRGTGGGGATSPAVCTGEFPLAHKDETLEYKRQLAAIWRQGHLSGAPERAGTAGG